MTPHCAPPLAASGGLAEELLRSWGSLNRAPDSHRIPEAPRPLAELSLGGGGSRGRPARGLTWHTCFRRVRIHACPRRKCSRVPAPRGPPSSPDLGVPTSPAPGVGVSWKLGPRRAGRVCRLACVSGSDTAFSLQCHGQRTRRAPPVHTRVFMLSPCAYWGSLQTRDRVGGIFATVLGGGRLSLHPGIWS